MVNFDCISLWLFLDHTLYDSWDSRNFVVSVKRKKPIELSKGEYMRLYIGEPEARWKSMEAY